MRTVAQLAAAADDAQHWRSGIGTYLDYISAWICKAIALDATLRQMYKNTILAIQCKPNQIVRQ
jgi:hypothetical protein